MIDQQVDLIFTAGTPTGVAAYKVTKDTGIPVIFGVIADPVVAGVMTNLSVPGGNMTGVMLSQNQTRRLEILLDIAPEVKRILFPYNPEDAAPVSAMLQLTPVAREMGIKVVEYHAISDEEVDGLFNDFPDVDAVFMLPDSTVNPRIAELIQITNEKGIPVSGPSTAQVEDGALICYGIVHSRVGEHAAKIANRVLIGGNPAEMPVEWG
jgi:putative ABC transport system substrate-binding protein